MATALAAPLIFGLSTGTVLTGLGAAFTLFSGMQQAKAQEAQAQRQQQIAQQQAEQTALVAERNALIIRDQDKYTAARLKEKGGAERATSQRKFIEERRQNKLVQSRAKAVAGASGGGVGDPTALDIYGGIAAEGEFAAQTALFEGESAASLLSSQAALALYEGEQRAVMTEFGGEQQADLIRYQGETALFEGKQAASNTRIAAIGSAVVSAGSLSAKYAPTQTGGSYANPVQSYSGQSVGTYQRY